MEGFVTPAPLPYPLNVHSPSRILKSFLLIRFSLLQAEHKIQSNQGCLQLTMHPTPKLLTPLVKEWAKNAFVVSFKVSGYFSFFLSFFIDHLVWLYSQVTNSYPIVILQTFLFLPTIFFLCCKVTSDQNHNRNAVYVIITSSTVGCFFSINAKMSCPRSIW